MTRNTNKTKEFGEKNSKCGSAGIGRQARLRGVCFGVRVQVPSLAPLPQIAGSRITGQVVELV